ncbi:UNVERIFIED_CONTAM: hypothetical protein HDU68_007515 [Siphonaria sp. JEL0065]|nr:hypothetical protein HDU68_007515 [Siphonaria sp. JEL0065]
MDALYAVEGTVRGILPPFVKDGFQVQSGTVIILPESENGTSSVKRWRDGYKWSASRVYGPFLVYRQIQNVTLESGEPVDEPSPTRVKSKNSGAKRSSGAKPGIEPVYERTLKTNTCIKENGLTKRTISIKGSDGGKYRVINYYKSQDVSRLEMRMRHPMVALRTSRDEGAVELFQTPTESELLKVVVEKECGGREGLAKLLAESLTPEMMTWSDNLDPARNLAVVEEPESFVWDVTTFVPQAVENLYRKYMDPTLEYPYQVLDGSARPIHIEPLRPRPMTRILARPRPSGPPPPRPFGFINRPPAYRPYTYGAQLFAPGNPPPARPGMHPPHPQQHPWSTYPPHQQHHPHYPLPHYPPYPPPPHT